MMAILFGDEEKINVFFTTFLNWFTHHRLYLSNNLNRHDVDISELPVLLKLWATGQAILPFIYVIKIFKMLEGSPSSIVLMNANI